MPCGLLRDVVTLLVPSRGADRRLDDRRRLADAFERCGPMENYFNDQPHGEREGHRFLDPEVAEVLRAGRLSCGWSFRTAGKQLDIAHGYLCSLEHGQRVPSVVVAELLMEGYGLGDRDASLVRSIALVGVGRDWHEGAINGPR
jgi:hypothetical protein